MRNKTSNMQLINGKFYDDAGNVVPAEFGNREQIRLIREAAIEKEFGPEVRTTESFTITADIYAVAKCLCGNTMTIQRQVELDDADEVDEFNAGENLEGVRFACSACQAQYVAKNNDDIGELTLKKL